MAMKILPVGESASTTGEVAGGSQLYHLPFMASKTTTALGHSQPWGRIEVFPSAVAAVAGHAALGDVYVVIQYGIRITEVAHNLQEAVKFAVERSVDVPVMEVNVNVQGVREERR
ncbi:MAG: Asp23/Gls24 family envelope stress response protein [Chloroflexi bacterium]|nr:MAG: Asp23/Gls24 family envelope stress response protein [Chloroflexota bacterium]